MRSVLLRAARAARRHGVAATMAIAGRRVLSRVHRHERHYWTYVRVDRPVDPGPLPPGYQFALGAQDDIPLLAGLGVHVPGAWERYRSGGQLFVVRRGERLAFAAWVFREFAPTVAAPGGRVRMPPGTVNIEDSLTAVEDRGQGLAPTAHRMIYRHVSEAGWADRLITKLEVENAASRRSSQKAGRREFALVDHRRLGPVRRTRVSPAPSELTHADDVLHDLEMLLWLTAAMREGA